MGKQEGILHSKHCNILPAAGNGDDVDKRQQKHWNETYIRYILKKQEMRGLAPLRPNYITKNWNHNKI